MATINGDANNNTLEGDVNGVPEADVWARDVLGGCDDEEGLGQDARV